jgi:hypothetical protein
LPGAGWVYGYAAVAIVCQLALLIPALAPFRVIFRSAAFGTSLLLLVMIPGHSRVQHPARTFAFGIVILVSLSAFNPEGGSGLAIVAHWCFYLAILGPIFWVARLDLNEKTLVRLLLIIWAFNTTSSILGVLQVLYPGRFQPAMSTFFVRPDQVMGYRLVTGEWVTRPMGLTDVPGGAASAGLYAVLIGFGVTLARPFRHARLLGVVGMLTGMMCIYLCHIRAVVVMMAICAVVLLATLALSGRVSQVTGAFSIGVIVMLVAFSAAFALSGQTTADRLASLIASDPGTVYRQNRGHFVADAFSETLPQYPLGAGLGRWGMVALYFGSLERALWSEVQWVGWILDGGFLMALVYPAAVVAMLVTLARIAVQTKNGDFGVWAAIVFAYGVGTFALTFAYPIFMSSGGIEFWLICAVAVQAASPPASGLVGRPS